MTIYTIGHGTLSSDAFGDLLREHGITRLVDVRSFPGSRKHPQFGRQLMEQWIPAIGVEYTWLQKLGGRRASTADSKHVGLRHESFRSYADYMETADFACGVRDLLAMVDRKVAFMCSETLWWKCHRRMIADYLTLIHGVTVTHIINGSRNMTHPPMECVRQYQQRLVYDQGTFL